MPPPRPKIAKFLSQPGSQRAFCRRAGARKLRRQLVGHQNVQALEIERQAHQAPFAGSGTHAA